MIKVFRGGKIIKVSDEVFNIFEIKNNTLSVRKKLGIVKLNTTYIDDDKNESDITSLTGNNVKEFLTNFHSRFQIIEAAGGLVRNEKGQYLFIFRNGKWDLPKGKIEKKETKRKAALREVKEECGMKDLKIVRTLTTTYHMYPLGEKEVVKPTYWFEMSCSSKQKFVAQAEEGITEIKWIGKSKLKSVLKDSYPSIKEVIEASK